MFKLSKLKKTIQKAKKVNMREKMNADKRRILTNITDCFAAELAVQDCTIAEKLALDIHRVRACLNELDTSGFIKQIISDTFDAGRVHVVTEITPEGHLVLRDELPIDRTYTHNSPLSINHFNAPVGIVQQGGQGNTANVNQNIGLPDCVA